MPSIPRTKIFISMFLLLCSFGLGAHSALAASLRFSATESYAIGSVLPVKVLVSTEASNPLNAVSASISYPVDKLQLQSVSKTSSIISYWVEEPIFSNSNGTVSFEGLVLNPGWSGVSGQVVTLNFKVIASGTAVLNFSKASVLANDGQGTNILNSASPASINLSVGAPVQENPVVLPGNGLPPAPVIKSSTHPNQELWYKNNTPSFSWTLPIGTTAVRLLYDKNPYSNPTVEYSPAISSRKLDVVADGSYYLHVQFKNTNGWGEVSHYKFQIDTEAPEPFNITLAHSEDKNDPRPILYFNTKDNISGISKYFVKVGRDKGVTVASDERDSNPYSPPNLEPGENKIVVIAYDVAGNITEEETVINIEAIDMPEIESYPKQLNKGDLLKIRGNSYPNSTVFIELKDEDALVASDFARTNYLGNFSIIWNKQLNKGLYSFTAYVIDDKGAKSYRTEPYVFDVKDDIDGHYGGLVTSIFSVALLSIIFLAILCAVGLYIYHHLRYFHRHIESKLNTKLHKAERQIEHDFDVLREELDAYITKLQKAEKNRKLSKEEKEFINNFKKYITAVEKDVISKLDSLEEEGK